MLQQWRSRVHRWHQLSRYYLNKWQYDGTKWAERVWYGSGSQSATSVASVPFMLTRQMRLDLERAGFPAHEIAALLPRTAHQLLADNVTYTQYCAQLKEQAAAAAAAGSSSSTAASTSSVDAHQEIHAIVQAIEAREQSENHTTDRSSSSLALVAPVEDPNEDRKTGI
ncbi:hypothetical protein PINS_up000936 [Pythium insidiosum]|nr:hypothetical protein PINS_up000936 [Pythium insidiosum]